MIIFISNNDPFAYECFLRLQQENELPVQWFSWEEWIKSPIFYQMTKHSTNLNSALFKTKVLYMNPLSSDFSGLYTEHHDHQYQRLSWLSVMMWLSTKIPVVINPLLPEILSPSFYSKERIKTLAFQHGLVSSLSMHQRTSNIVKGTIEILFEDAHCDEKFSRLIPGCRALLNELHMIWGQCLFNKDLELVGVSSKFTRTTNDVLVKKAISDLKRLYSRDRIQPIGTLKDNGFSIQGELRPKLEDHVFRPKRVDT